MDFAAEADRIQAIVETLQAEMPMDAVKAMALARLQETRTLLSLATGAPTKFHRSLGALNVTISDTIAEIEKSIQKRLLQIEVPASEDPDEHEQSVADQIESAQVAMDCLDTARMTATLLLFHLHSAIERRNSITPES